MLLAILLACAASACRAGTNSTVDILPPEVKVMVVEKLTESPLALLPLALMSRSWFAVAEPYLVVERHVRVLTGPYVEQWFTDSFTSLMERRLAPIVSKRFCHVASRDLFGILELVLSLPDSKNVNMFLTALTVTWRIPVCREYALGTAIRRATSSDLDDSARHVAWYALRHLRTTCGLKFTPVDDLVARHILEQKESMLARKHLAYRKIPDVFKVLGNEHKDIVFVAVTSIIPRDMLISNPEIVRVLVQHGADVVNEADVLSSDVRLVRREQRYLEALLSAPGLGVNKDVVSWAIETGSRNTLTRMISERPLSLSIIPLHALCQHRHMTWLLKDVVRRRPVINLATIDVDGRTPLMTAVLHDNIDAMQCLIETKSDIGVNVRDNNGQTALHLAIEAFNLLAVDTLLTVEDLNFDIQNRDGSPPLKAIAARLANRLDVPAVFYQRGLHIMESLSRTLSSARFTCQQYQKDSTAPLSSPTRK
ncbi:hypothetical protein PBRA_002130 [Plasmodiophora brassicae]|uniref:Uncharacterized protein n=1 Tax=Plasmodiophora brassicae TaxID=37360 RepID=A0A0G4J2C7_PLABS|nr:hypothetical protein PBRA_002130 [Plasmodiophora brassicae]